MSHSSAAASFGGDDFAWACALEPLDFTSASADGAHGAAWDAALVEVFCGAGAGNGETTAAQGKHASRCRIRACGAALTPGYSQRAKLCEAHLHADVLELPDSGGPGRFCQRCHKLQPLAQFSGAKRTCDAALAAFNRKRRAQHSERAAAAAAGTAAMPSALAVVRPLREADEAVPLTLESALRQRLSAFVACTADMLRGLASGAPPALSAADARMLRFCVPPSDDAAAALAADGAELAAVRAALSAEQAAEGPAWSGPPVSAAQRAERHVALLAAWAARAAEAADAAEGTTTIVPPHTASGLVAANSASSTRALCAALRPCVDAMNALLAHTQAALALLRLESRGRYLAGAGLACELGAALMRRADEVCKQRGAWLAGGAQGGYGQQGGGMRTLTGGDGGITA